jgi:hypothetical protein
MENVNNVQEQEIHINNGIVRLIFEGGDWVQMPVDMLKETVFKSLKSLPDALPTPAQ